MTDGVKILTHSVARARPAVTNVAAAVRHGPHEEADFGGEWMMLAIPSRVQPQDLPCGSGRRERVQHRQNRRRPDSGAKQHDGPLSRLQNEASARRADVESIAHVDMLPEVGSSHAIRLELHADSIALRRNGTRERVAAKKWSAAGRRLKTQDQVLTWQRRWQRLTLRVLHS